MTLDSEGNIVATAGFNTSGPGPMIYHFDPEGRVIQTFEAPEDSPTNCTFGGDKKDILYVTFATGAVYMLEGTGLTGQKIDIRKAPDTINKIPKVFFLPNSSFKKIFANIAPNTVPISLKVPA